MEASRAGRDAGFSLVEVMLALLVAAIAAVMFVQASSSTNRLSATNRGLQEATAIAADELEHARSLPWAQLAMSEFDSDAPLLLDGTPVLDGAAAGVPANEPLVVASGGGIAPSGTVVRGGVTFHTWSYVSNSFYTADVVRIVVLVEWDNGETQRERIFSTLISKVGSS